MRDVLSRFNISAASIQRQFQQELLICASNTQSEKKVLKRQS